MIPWVYTWNKDFHSQNTNRATRGFALACFINCGEPCRSDQNILISVSDHLIKSSQAALKAHFGLPLRPAVLIGLSAFKAVWAQHIKPHFWQADPVHAQVEPFFDPVVAMGLKQYNSFTDFKVRLALGVHKATSIQTFDFSTLYTSIPHDLLKSRMNNIINNAFKHKNGATRYTHIKVGRNKSYFTSDPLNGDNKYTANDICKMIEFLVDNIYVRFGGQLFRQMVGIPMGTNCAPLLADLFLYSYENEFLDKLIKEGKRKLARRFNLSYRYIDDLISFNNKRFKVQMKCFFYSRI